MARAALEMLGRRFYLGPWIVNLLQILCDGVIHNCIVVAQVIEREGHVDSLLAINLAHRKLLKGLEFRVQGLG